jgi:NAD(P)-dependent dehydrogenase (short-subunit alcohol dehydrogenase family)
MLARFKSRFPWWAHVTFVSSVGAINEGIVDLGYSMAKAALDKAARALAAHEAWRVSLVRLDLVDTDTVYKIPVETLHGRPVLSAEEAARHILDVTFGGALDALGH